MAWSQRSSLMQTLEIPEGQRQRLLLFNLRTDADDHILVFTTRWINELAQYYAHVDVLTMHMGRLAVADNVRVFSVGRERGVGKARRVLNFYRILARLLAQNRYDACFAHMMPLFAVMGAPLLRLRGVRVTTWYTHRQMSAIIRWAERLSYRIVTAVPESFPVDSPKVRPLGHGIDTDFYTPDDTQEPTRPRIVQVARLTPIKHQHVLLQAIAGLDCEVVFVGDIPDGYDDKYKQALIQQVADMGLSERVTFAGAQTPEQVRTWYRSTTLAVNLSPPGLFDKAALEAMAIGVPTIVSSEAFTPVTGPYAAHLHIPAPDEVEILQETLALLLAMSTAQRHTISTHLHERVVAQHSLQALVPKLINVMHTGERPD